MMAQEIHTQVVMSRKKSKMLQSLGPGATTVFFPLSTYFLNPLLDCSSAWVAGWRPPSLLTIGPHENASSHATIF